MLGIRVLGKTTRIEAPGIPFAFAVNDQFSEDLAVTAAFANSSTQTNDAVGIFNTGNRANQGQAINRIGNRSIDNTVYTSRLQSG